MIVYADESGTHDKTGNEPGSQTACIAGYIADVDQWARLCDEWVPALKEFGLSSLHMREIYEWPKDTQSKLIRKLAQIAHRNTLFGIAAVVSVKDYDKIFPDDAKGLLPHPYYVALLPFIGVVLDELHKRRIPPERVNFVFDRTNDFSKYGSNLFYLAKDNEDMEGRLGDVGFGDKADHIELQVADLLAHTTRRKSFYILQEFVSMRRPKLNAQDKAFGLAKHVILHLDDANGLHKKISAVEKRGLEWKWPGGKA